MKCFTITGGFDQPTVQPWVDVQDQHIILGEAGRGRSRALVPIPAAAEIEHETRLVQIRDHAGLALVLRDMSGYRGTWALFGNYTVEEWQQLYARRIAHRANGTGPLQDGHTENFLDNVCPLCDAMPAPAERHPVPTGLIRAKGWCAQGDAGRMGGGPEYFLITDHPISLFIVRAGRGYGSSMKIVVDVDPAHGTVTLDDAWERAARPHLAHIWDLS